MNRIFTFFAFIFLLQAKAQVFSGVGGAIQNNGQDTYFSISVSGLNQSQLDNTLGIERVCIDINHPAVEELYIYLQSPTGTIVELTEGSSCKGVNYTGTCFDSGNNTSITVGSAPYASVYKPVGYIGRFNNGQAGNGTWTLIVHDYLAFINSGNLIGWNITFGNSPAPSLTFTSSNLPIVVINTNSQAITNAKIHVNMGIIDNGTARNNTTDSWNNYNSKVSINLRGSSTKNFEKKSYSLETEDMTTAQMNVSILGMPIENDWELVAPYQDKSLLRIPLTYDLFREMGHYASRFKDVELVLNNEYQGVYTLMEKIKRDSCRVHVSKLGPTDNLMPNITGGYILKIDRPDAPGWSSLLPGNSPTNSHFYYQYVYPKDTAITGAQTAYIKGFMNDFETTLNSASFADPINGYSKYIATGSFIDFFIINELSKNVDAYRLSTYLYKERITKGGKLHIGPVWDYDIAWHNCNYGNSFDPTGWQYQIPDSVSPPPLWWNRLLQDSNFVNSLYCRWHELRQGMLSNNTLYAYIDSSVSVLNESRQRNFIQWPILGTYIYPNPQSQLNATYQTEIDDLKNWIANRTAWMDANIIGTCSNVGIAENQFAENSVHCFPNPFRNNFNITFQVIENAKVKIDILNLQGEQVISVLNDNKTAGTYHEEVSTQQLAAGVYVIKLSVNDLVYHQKLVKL
jgi:subtilisin-like proprotein convertase family protein